MATILLVEDNMDMQIMLRDLLVWDGHEVICESTGQRGLSALMGFVSAPDVIISDLTMPEMDGLEFLYNVRSDARWEDVRFIMMSANPYDERLTVARDAGADGTLPKPFSLDDLHTLLG
jgi:CheY-like chemotaxis protein